jgi:thymidine kinase
MGNLELLLGPMRSNKTSELIHRVSIRQEYGHHNVLVVKPTTDTKSGGGLIETRDRKNKQRSIRAFEIPPKNPWMIFDILAAEEKKIGGRFECVAIDEGQFFEQFFAFVDTLLRRGYDAIIVGLDRDFRGEPFGDMLNLTALAMTNGGGITWRVAYCTKCGQKATLSQRLINGEPAPYNSDLITPGDSYEPRCQSHFFLPDRPYPM